MGSNPILDILFVHSLLLSFFSDSVQVSFLCLDSFLDSLGKLSLFIIVFLSFFLCLDIFLDSFLYILIFFVHSLLLSFFFQIHFLDSLGKLSLFIIVFIQWLLSLLGHFFKFMVDLDMFFGFIIVFIHYRFIIAFIHSWHVFVFFGRSFSLYI
ncbi:hypothetical protein ACJX0J_038712 [Zea mays]